AAYFVDRAFDRPSLIGGIVAPAGGDRADFERVLRGGALGVFDQLLREGNQIKALVVASAGRRHSSRRSGHAVGSGRGNRSRRILARLGLQLRARAGEANAEYRDVFEWGATQDFTEPRVAAGIEGLGND